METPLSQRPDAVNIVQRMTLGGIETFVLDLVRQPDQKNTIISLEGTREELVQEWPALAPVAGKIIGLGGKGGIRPSAVLRLARILKDLRPTSVLLHHIGPLLYGGIAARMAGVRNVIHVEHDTWHYSAKPRHELIARRLESFLKPRHVCQSRTTAKRLSEILPGASIEIVPTGVDLERFKPGDKAGARARLGLEMRAPIVGTVGRLEPVKGHSRLLAAFRYLPGDVRLVIAGDGAERAALEAQAAAGGVAARVTFLGHRDDIEEILPAFDLFCLPSLNEGFPRSLLEAQACEVPVIATDVGAVREAVCPETGLVVEGANAIILAQAMERTLNRPLGQSPRDFIETNFSWRKTLDSYRQVAEA
jgi:glycosyltransferase involved in cell wall biosynthesis